MIYVLASLLPAINTSDFGVSDGCVMVAQRFSVPGCSMFHASVFVPSRAFAFLLRPALSIALSFGAGAALAADNFSGVYSVSLIGLSLGSATVSGKVSGTDYKIEAYANLTGIASALSGAKGSAVASGAIQNGQILPAAYATSSANARESRTVRIGMTGGTVKAVDIQPPFEQQEGRVPLSDAHKKNIVDPLSALIMPLKAADGTNGPAVCNRSIPVFDGYTRFNVDLAYTGTRQVSTPGYNGPVIVCNARYKPVAGHRPGRKATQFMTDNKDMEVWLVPINGGKIMIPYRIAVRTMVGMTVIEARKFTTGSDTAGSIPAAAAQR